MNQSGSSNTPRHPSRPDGPRPPYREAAACGLAVFGLYAVTLAPTTAFWDTSEYIATAHILGIPHPPGNPLFVVLARAWSVLLAPFGIPVPMRVNLFSAAMGAGAHALWFLVIHHILRYFSEDRFFRLAGAAVAVIVSATAFTVWAQSNVNEKVYTVTLLTIALLTWLTFRWQEKLGRGRDGNILVLMAFILGLSVGNHLMAILVAPAIGIFILVVQPKSLTNWRVYAAGLVAVFVGMSIHLFLPIRAVLEPLINEGAPVCEGIGSALASIASYGEMGCEPLSESLARNQYQKPPLHPRQAPLIAQIGNYLQYFDWQWARRMAGTDTHFPGARAPFTALFFVLGIWGAIRHYKRDRASFLFMATLFGTLSLVLVYYLNFKYGYSYPRPDGSVWEVRERDYFFIVSFSVWGLWAGMGIVALWQQLALERRFSFRKASPVLGIALIPLIMNWPWASRAHDYSARDWAYNLLMSVEPYGVIFTNGDNDTFPLWYLQEVEGVRQDVTVMVTSYLNIDWYALQLKRITEPCAEGVDPADRPTRIVCQRPYTDETTTAAYVSPGDEDVAEERGKVPVTVGGGVRAPTRSVLPSSIVSDEEIRLRSTRVELVPGPISAGGVTFNFPVAGDGVPETPLQPWQQFGIIVIANSIGERPIYFASNGGAVTALGLRDQVVRQGLAFRLSPVPPGESGNPDWLSIGGREYSEVTGDWIDFARTRLLEESVFVHRDGIPDEWPFWPEPSTTGIPRYYSWMYIALAEGAATVGNEDEVPVYAERVQAWSRIGYY